MFAIPAAKRTLVLIMSLALLVFAATAVAGEEKGYLGVVLQDISPSMAKALQIEEDTGVMVNEVVDDSPAAKAGLEDGDVILSFNGEKITDYGDLTNAVRKTSPGDEVEVVVLRAGKKKNFAVEVGQHEAKNVFFMSDEGDVHAPHFKHFESDGANVWVMSDDENDVTWNVKKNDFVFNSNRGYMGVHLDDINEQMGEYFGVEGGEGALVTEVVEDSPAAEAGLQAGDVITKVDDTEIASMSDLHEMVQGTEKDQKVQIGYMRKGKFSKVEVTLAEAPETEFSDQIKIMTDRAHNMHFSGPSKLHIKRAPHGERHVEVIREMHGGADEELQEMRDELEKMRQELEEMRNELKK